MHLQIPLSKDTQDLYKVLGWTSNSTSISSSLDDAAQHEYNSDTILPETCVHSSLKQLESDLDLQIQNSEHQCHKIALLHTYTGYVRVILREA